MCDMYLLALLLNSISSLLLRIFITYGAHVDIMSYVVIRIMQKHN